MTHIIILKINLKQYPPDITTFDEIPNESKKNIIKQKRDEIFMIFKKKS